MCESCTKIVATVGPACWEPDQLEGLIAAGVDIFRLNTAHGTRQEHEQTLASIRRASEQCDFPVGVLLDLSGPKLRLGELPTESVECELGDRVSFIRGQTTTNAGELTSSYAKLIDELDVGNRVLLADGAVTMVVESVSDDRAECRVTASGTIRSRQGINLPDVNLSVSSMLPKDIDNAIWGAENGIDFISLSFVRRAEDVLMLKSLLVSHDSNALVIAKIEKPEALRNLDAIVDATDGVMAVSYTHLTLPTTRQRCRSRWSPYH